MGGDSRAWSAALEAPVPRWGMVTAAWDRQLHGYDALSGVPPRPGTGPVPHGVQDRFTLGVEKDWGRFPGSLRLEGRVMRESGDRGRLGALENWGLSVIWRR